MSVNYTMELVTKLNQNEIFHTLFPSITDHQVRSDTGNISLTTEGVPIFIGEPEGLTDSFCYSQEIEIIPTIYISLYLKGRGTPVTIMEVMLRWLINQEGDAVLFDDDASIVLMRKDGLLIRNSREELWTPEMLRVVTLPHKVKHIPVL